MHFQNMFPLALFSKCLNTASYEAEKIHGFHYLYHRPPFQNVIQCRILQHKCILVRCEHWKLRRNGEYDYEDSDNYKISR
jgi:hypothetical protein